MNAANFDLEALIRAIALSLAGGFVIGAFSYFVMRARPDWTRKKPVLIMGTAGIVLFLLVGIYYIWPNLVEVPELDGRAQAEAEDMLVKRGLVPDSRPQLAAGVESGRVVPHSQSPVRALLVHRGTTVSFGVATSSGGPGVDKPPAGGTSSTSPTASLFEPRGGSTVAFTRSGDGLYRCSTRGISSGLDHDFQLLLWLRPVKPPSDQFGVWYLQRAGNGTSVEPDGTWHGVAQLGNAQYPPQNGYTFELAISVADAKTARSLLNEPGVVTRDHPIGAQSAIVSNLTVRVR
jgi:hypothetical protein